MKSVQEGLTEKETDLIRKEVTEQFIHLVSAINQLDAAAWSEHYSKDEFLSAIVSTDHYAARSEWVDVITSYFSTRKRQQVEPVEVRVTALTSNLALMTSEERSEMELKSGEATVFRHVFTMLWKKEPDGWKILHSHESWGNDKF